MRRITNTRVSFVISALVILLLLVSSSLFSQTAIEKHMELGKAHLRIREWDKAREEFQQVLKLDPDNSLAKSYLKKVDFLEARAIKEAKVAKVEAKLKEVDKLLKGNEFDLAGKALQEAKAIYPEYRKIAVYEKKIAEAKRRAEEKRQQEIARQKELAIRQLLKKADKALAGKEFDTAAKLYREVLQESPGRKEAESGLRKVEEAKAKAIEEAKIAKVEAKLKEVDKLLKGNEFDLAGKALQEAKAIYPEYRKIAVYEKKIAKAERAYQEAKKREALKIAEAKRRAEEKRQQEIARQKEEAIQQLLKKADKALARKEFDIAAKLYREVLQESPGRKEAEAGLRKVEEARARTIEETKLQQKSQVESEALKEARLKAQIIEFEKKLREKKIKESAGKLLDRGVTYLKQKEYEKAISTFEEILSRYPNYPEAKTYLAKAKDLLARSKKKKVEKEEAVKEKKIDTYYTLGYRYFRKEEFKQAIQEFQKVLSINPEHKNAKFFLELAQEGEKAKSIREEKERQRALLTVHYKEARHLYNEGDYEDAINILEVVVAKDPQFKEAVFWLNQAKLAQAKLEGKKLEEEMKVQRERRLLEVEKASIPSRKPGEYKKAEIRKKTSAEETLAIEAIKKKAMQKVSLEFTNANLRDVIMFLSRQTGINIVIDESIFRESAAAAAPEPVAPEVGGMPPAPGEEEAAPVAAPQPTIPSPATMKITASLRDIPLIEALKVLLYSRGLGFVIKPYYIWVTYLYKSLKTEVFDLQFLALPRIPLGEIRTEGGEGGGVQIELQKGIEERLKEQGAGGAGTQGAEAGGTTEGNEMLILLNQLFPPVPGSSRQIIPSQNRLVVRDTEENIENIRKFLNSLSIPYQVSVEARFITVGADALRDIGLELSNFNLNVVGPYDTKSRQSGIPGQPWQYDTMTGSLMSGVGTPIIGMISGSQGLNITYTRLNYPQFSAVLHLLMARSDTQVLSAPKVTVINGQLAQIRFVRNIPYVSDVDASTSTTGTGESAKSTTTFDYTFKSINVGIILNVIPRIFGENILLSLNPTVSDVAEFKTFIISQTAGEAPLTIEQPVPEVQDASTQLIVHDGDTVVLGGLMKGKTVAAISKIPFLGDIPVIGKAFFQKKTKGQEKRNLLIFITVKRMDTSGEPLSAR